MGNECQPSVTLNDKSQTVAQQFLRGQDSNGVIPSQ